MIKKILKIAYFCGPVLLFGLSVILTSPALAGTATLSWNANTESDLDGYKIYYGTSPRTGTDPKICGLCGYSINVSVGNVTTYNFSNLTNGQTYYFSVTAYDTSNNESAFSSPEVSKIISADTLAITAVSPLYLFRGQTNTLSITGSGFNLSTNFYLRFLSGLTTVSSITRQPASATSFNVSITTTEIDDLPVGFYDLKLERSTDSASTTYSQKILVTVLGDVSSPTSGVRDCKVDIYDASRLLSKWGSTLAADLAELDINFGPGNVSQGRIDLYDANKMMVNWLP